MSRKAVYATTHHRRLVCAASCEEGGSSSSWAGVEGAVTKSELKNSIVHGVSRAK